MPYLSIEQFFTGGSKAYFIAVGSYKLPVTPLLSPINDVASLKEVLENKHGFKVADVQGIGRNGMPVTYTNPLIDPDGPVMLDFLSSIITHEDERVLLYFAGHGIALDSDTDPEGYFLPCNADPANISSFVAMRDILTRIQQFRCRHLLVILDCCYAGSFRWSDITRGFVTEIPKTIYFERFKQYTRSKAWQVITSSAHDQKALDILRLGNRERDGDNQQLPLSPFAAILVNALETGHADMSFGNSPADGVITATELGFYLRQQISGQLHGRVRANDQQIPLLFPLAAHEKGEFVFLHPNKRNGHGELELPNRTNQNPYKGLDAYTINDSAIFYGRQRVLDGWYDGKMKTEGLKTLAAKYKLLIITGPSGIGKSSLVKAGLLSIYKGIHGITEIRPGKTPFSSHQQTIADIKAAAGRQVLLVDQYEELATICEHPSERASFEALLGNLLDGPHLLVITIRSDFETQFKASPLLSIQPGQAAVKCRFVVPPFLREEIEEMVIQPAVQEVLEFKPLVEEPRGADKFIGRIVNDAFQNPGSLPLLSLTLSTLYEKREGRNLLEACYEGVIGVLDQRVTAIYNHYKGNQLQESLFRNLIYRTISIQGGQIAKRRIYYDEELVFSEPEKTDGINAIRQALEKARLFSADVDDTGRYTEPSHDAFLRSWPLLTAWLQEKTPDTQHSVQTGILLHRTVHDIALTYKKETAPQKKQQYLWVNDPRLDEVRKYLPARLNAAEQDFINASYREKLRKKRVWWTTASIVSLLIVAAAIIAVIQANISAREARKNRALYTAASAEALAPHNAFAAMAEADKLAPDEPLVYDYFLRFSTTLANFNGVPFLIVPGRGVIRQLQFDTSSHILRVTGDYTIAEISLLNRQSTLLSFPQSIRNTVYVDSITRLVQTENAIYICSKGVITDSIKVNNSRALALLPGRPLFAASDGQNIKLFRTDNLRLEQEIAFNKDIYNIYFSPDAMVMLVTSNNYVLHRFQSINGKWLFKDSLYTDIILKEPGQMTCNGYPVIKAVRFSPSGSYFSTTNCLGDIKIFETSGRCIDSLNEGIQPDEGASEDADYIGPSWAFTKDIYLSGKGNVYLNEISRGRVTRKKIYDKAAIAMFAPGDSLVFLLTEEVILYKAGLNGAIKTTVPLSLNKNSFESIQVGAQHNFIVKNADNSIHIIDENGRETGALGTQNKNTVFIEGSNNFAFSADNQYYAACDNNYTLYIWNVGNNQLLSRIKVPFFSSSYMLRGPLSMVATDNRRTVLIDAHGTSRMMAEKCSQGYTSNQDDYPSSADGSLVLLFNDSCAQGVFDIPRQKLYKTDGWQHIATGYFNTTADTILLIDSIGAPSWWVFKQRTPQRIQPVHPVAIDSSYKPRYQAILHGDFGETPDTLILMANRRQQILALSFPGYPINKFVVSPTGKEFLVDLTHNGESRFKLFNDKGTEIREFYADRIGGNAVTRYFNMDFSPDGMRIINNAAPYVEVLFSWQGMKDYLRNNRPEVTDTVSWGPVAKIVPLKE